MYDLNNQIEKSLERKFWLNCGGFITIDKTEALTAIDVNSGKYIGGKSLEQTIYTVNKEATIEIAKQSIAKATAINNISTIPISNAKIQIKFSQTLTLLIFLSICHVI